MLLTGNTLSSACSSEWFLCPCSTQVSNNWGSFFCPRAANMRLPLFTNSWVSYSLVQHQEWQEWEWCCMRGSSTYLLRLALHCCRVSCEDTVTVSRVISEYAFSEVSSGKKKIRSWDTWRNSLSVDPFHSVMVILITASTGVTVTAATQWIQICMCSLTGILLTTDKSFSSTTQRCVNGEVVTVCCAGIKEFKCSRLLTRSS